MGEGENEVKEASEKWGAGTRMRARDNLERARTKGLRWVPRRLRESVKCADAYASPLPYVDRVASIAVHVVEDEE